jgi:hypothetical protein
MPHHEELKKLPQTGEKKKGKPCAAHAVSPPYSRHTVVITYQLSLKFWVSIDYLVFKPLVKKNLIDGVLKLKYSQNIITVIWLSSSMTLFTAMLSMQNGQKMNLHKSKEPNQAHC